MGQGLNFVLARQDAAGSWTDWDLPPGPSSEWTTAYVGYRLSGITALRNRAAGPLTRAAQWLLANRSDQGGWGYNKEVAPDADSTALAILFLSAIGQPVPREAYAHLRGYQQPDGGFATFLPDPLMGSWGQSHPEITPVALLALLTDAIGSHDAVIQRGVDWVRRARRPTGDWNAFWWTTGHRSTEASLALLQALGRGEAPCDAVDLTAPCDSLQTAALLLATTVTGSSHLGQELGRRLLAWQAPDGSWCGDPALRITRRNCIDPWNHTDAGPLYADPRRLFTTATALAALATLLR